VKTGQRKAEGDAAQLVSWVNRSPGEITYCGSENVIGSKDCLEQLFQNLDVSDFVCAHLIRFTTFGGAVHHVGEDPSALEKGAVFLWELRGMGIGTVGILLRTLSLVKLDLVVGNVLGKVEDVLSRGGVLFNPLPEPNRSILDATDLLNSGDWDLKCHLVASVK
jgi:hypothetical protein